jgi:beta-xylosidase
LLAIGGLHAPTIRYHDGTFYIVCTNVTHNGGENPKIKFHNFIISTKDIWGGHWSDPVEVDLHGFDPSLFFDDDGKAYFLGAQVPGPDLKTILYEVDLPTGDKLSKVDVIYHNPDDFYPEGPHLYKKDGYYFLVFAEGGTHSAHTVKVARSQTIQGPYELYDGNPILSSHSTKDLIQHVGHSDLFQDQNGDWWAVCLGVRRIGDRYVLGRETFLTKGTWPQGGWPSLRQVTLEVGEENAFPTASSALPPAMACSPELLYIRDADLSRFDIDDNRRIGILPSPDDFDVNNGKVAFVGKRQRKLEGVARVEVNTTTYAHHAELKAGLAYYKEELRWVKIFYDFAVGEVVLEIVNHVNNTNTHANRSVNVADTIEFSVKYTDQLLEFNFRSPGLSSEWTKIGSLDTKEMTAFDFVGPIIGVFAIGEAGTSHVQFHNLHVD